MEWDQFIGKTIEDLECALGFTYYLEVKDRMILGKAQKHSDIVDSFFKFVEGNITVVKTDNGVVEEFFEMDNATIKHNLLLLEKEQGIFHDADIYISYAFSGSNFFAYVLSNMLMFSATEEETMRMARILDNCKIKYFEPYEIGQQKIQKALRKLGRNEACHCGSGKKYKKCCLATDKQETGRVKKVPSYYESK